MELNATERTFLDESRRASEREVERQRRMNRRLRVAARRCGGPARRGRGGGRVRRPPGPARRGRGAPRDGAATARQQQRPADQARQRGAQRALPGAHRLGPRGPRPGPEPGQAPGRRGDERRRHADLPVDQRAPPGAGRRPDRRPLHLAQGPSRARAVHQPCPRRPAPRGHRNWPPGGRRPEDRDGAVVLADRDVGLRPETTSWAVAWFSADGTEVIAGLWWGKADVAPPAGITLGVAIWNAQTGELKRTIDVGPCGGAVPAVSRSRALVWTPFPGPDGQTGCHWPDDGIDTAGGGRPGHGLPDGPCRSGDLSAR